MAPIYRKSAPRRLAWPDIQYISPAQACMALSNTSPASSRLAGPRRSLRQRHAGLRGPVEVFASIKQAAGPRRSLRQHQAGLHGPVEVFASVKWAWLSYPAGGRSGGQSGGREGGLGAGIYLCPRFKPKKKQIYEQFDLPIPESGK